jgi:hypothetical protein
MVPVQDQATLGTAVCALAQALLHAIPTARTVLRGEVGRNRNDGNAMQATIIAHPGQEETPRCIADTLRKPMILDHVGNLEVFVGDQIVRLDQRPRSFAREVFTLPTHVQIPFGKPFDGLFTVLGPLDFARDAPMQALQLSFCLAETSVD